MPEWEKKIVVERERLSGMVCHSCGKTGHLARTYKGKGVAGAAVAAHESAGPARAENVDSCREGGVRFRSSSSVPVEVSRDDMGHSLGLL